jgi:hypothetical protein
MERIAGRSTERLNARRLQCAALSMVVMSLAACRDHRPAALSAGPSDTILVNSYERSALPVRAVDRSGRVVPFVPIRYVRTAGDEFGLSADGKVGCGRRGEMVIRAEGDRLSRSFLVRCRPLKGFLLPGPVQFVLGDSALSQPIEIPLFAYDSGGRAVTMVGGMMKVLNPAVAGARGSTVFPRTRGVTLLGAWAGRKNAFTGVHIYQRVDAAALDSLPRIDASQRQFAVPVALARDEERRIALPRGTWMVTTLGMPGQAPEALRVRFENATCTPGILSDLNRYSCQCRAGAVAIVTRLDQSDAAAMTGYLLVRGFFPGNVEAKVADAGR